MENYKTLKAAGKVSVSKDGDVLQTVKKVYDADTGEESTVTSPITLKEAAIKLGMVKGKEFDRIVQPKKMI